MWRRFGNCCKGRVNVVVVHVHKSCCYSDNGGDRIHFMTNIILTPSLYPDRLEASHFV